MKLGLCRDSQLVSVMVFDQTGIKGHVGNPRSSVGRIVSISFKVVALDVDNGADKADGR